MKLTTMFAIICALFGGVRLAYAADPTPINIGVYPGTLQSVAAYIGRDMGIYERHGIKATLSDFRAAPEATAALFSGSIDLMNNSIGNMMLVNSRGKELVGIIDNYPAPVWGIVVRPEMPTPNQTAGYPALIKDLKGKRIGVPAIGSEGHNFARRFVKDAGLDPEKDVTFLAVGLGPDALAGFKAKQIDGIIALEPVLTLLQHTGGKKLLDLYYDRVIPGFAAWTSNTWLTTREYADKHADAMHRFQAAQEEVISVIRDSSKASQVGAIWAKYNKALSADDLTKIVSGLSGAFSVKFNCIGTDNVGKFMVENNLVKPSHAQTCEQLAWSGAGKYLDR